MKKHYKYHLRHQTSKPFLITSFLILFSMPFSEIMASKNYFTFQQKQAEVSGVVTNLKGEPLPSVSVRIKGSSSGIATDANGKFSIHASQNATLIFSFIGYENTEIVLNGRSNINVTLIEKIQELDQVVVVGYGTQRKVDVTGATASVKGEELTKQSVLTATQAIQGKVAGVQIISSGKPGSSPVVKIRGTGTALAGTSALFVVDGVLTDDISNINTADIVSMDILKDASATAIYGARGANGVIILTTKRGENGKMKISYNANVGFREASNLVKMANAAEYANYASTASGGSIPAGAVSTDWYGQILRTAWMQNHNLSLSGGTDKSIYFLSVGYLTDEGIVINSKYDRITVRSNNEFNLSEKFKVGTNVSFSNGYNQDVNLGTAYNNAYRAAPIIPSKIDGKYGNTSVYQNVGNPVLDIENNDNLLKDNRLQGNFYAEYQPIKSLKFRSSLGGDWLNANNRVYNQQFNNDLTTFITSGGNQRNPNSNLTMRNTETFRWVWDNTITFNHQIDKHTFTALIGTTAEKYSQTWFSAFRKDVPANQDLWYISTGNANTSTNDGSGDKWTRNSYIGRVNYNYDDKYLFTATVRRDGSSRFPIQNRWGYFPSLGAGWVVSNENFMQEQSVFKNLKLRASWGIVGNDRIPSDAFTVTITPNLAYPYGGGIATPGSAITQIKDPNLKWETTSELDFGLEFGMVGGRLQGEINYYNKKANDLLINVKVPSVAGDADGVVLTNAASISNIGWEFSLNWRGNITSDLTYKVGGNVTFNKNSVIGLNGGQPILDGGIGANQTYTTKTDNGQPVGSFYVLKVLGVFQNDSEVENYKNTQGSTIQPNAAPGDFKYQDTNNDGKIDDQDRVFAGSYQPVAYFGLNASLSFKGFDLNLDAFGNAGNQVYNGKKAFRQGVLDNVESQMAYTRWTSANKSQTEPAANGGNLPASTYFIESGNFIRLNNVTLGYNLPSSLVKKAKLSNVRVFVTAQNIFTYKDFSGFTPELAGDPTKSGIELNAYPTNKTIAAGLSVGF
ncbi:TonB-linked SusC/RagA family outer membrane protein [Arcicella aurantiaca]|uniref:TonB-linked SusC/RagA family outer membrane protein n=1 Tax=Arcicella aurantiaca TaxID=591202 RepID=A0A316EV06_9BACT|nr:TonB-dependent receptor [Arcicella aurantiaca]PWK27076.1 TonB-linked SusC/RagA family outer membrane protein [Arcicella aurantiaca]